MYDPQNHSSLLWIDLVPALVPLGSARWQKRKISAHYRELIWFLIWFHLVPHVGRSPKSQFTIRNWFGSWFGSTWFRSCEMECCEEPLPTMYWGSVGLMGRLRKKCLSFCYQHRKPNVNWISSLSESDRLEIQLTFVLGHWYNGGPKLLPGCWGGHGAKLANSNAIMDTSAVISVRQASIKF